MNGEFRTQSTFSRGLRKRSNLTVLAQAILGIRFAVDEI
jgi:hypothetical protein